MVFVLFRLCVAVLIREGRSGFERGMWSSEVGKMEAEAIRERRGIQAAACSVETGGSGHRQ